MNEKLSAFVDNELSELEERGLLREMERDAALRASWGRYHLIRAALRKELEYVAPAGLAITVAGSVAADTAHHRRRVLALGVGKIVGGLAIAASVATAAILSLSFPLGPAKPVSLATSVNGAPIATVAARDASRSGPNPLNAYLVEHNEFAPTAGMGNMLPYMRTVSHDNTTK